MSVGAHVWVWMLIEVTSKRDAESAVAWWGHERLMAPTVQTQSDKFRNIKSSKKMDAAILQPNFLLCFKKPPENGDNGHI